MVSSQPLYTPLPEGRWFRLLRLLPGSLESQIECELVVVKLDQAPAYEPVSYAWEDPTPRQRIICNGCPILVTSSAYQVLRRFRELSRQRMIWLDGICIDQTCDLEKNQQVAFMSSVYARGSQTLVWLGGPKDGIDHNRCSCGQDGARCVANALDLIKSVNAYFEDEFEQLEDSAEGDVWAKVHQITSNPKTVDWLASKNWDCAVKFYSRPYFSRCWVLGEVGISTRAEVFCGLDSLPWSDIVLFAVE